MKKKHKFQYVPMENDCINNGSQKAKYKCKKCGEDQEMYIREAKTMNNYFFKYYSSCI